MTLDEVKAIPMRAVAERYGLQPNRAGFIRCPFHQEKSGSMKLYARDAHCFGCGWNGDQIDFVRQMDGLDFKEAFMALGGTYPDDVESRAETQRRVRQAETERRKREEREAEMKRKKEANNRYITLLRNGIECFPVFSEEWCFCQNELVHELYRHDILNGLGAAP